MRARTKNDNFSNKFGALHLFGVCKNMSKRSFIDTSSLKHFEALRCSERESLAAILKRHKWGFGIPIEKRVLMLMNMLSNAYDMNQYTLLVLNRSII